MVIAYYMLLDAWRRLFQGAPVCVDLRRQLLEATRQERRKARGGR